MVETVFGSPKLPITRNEVRLFRTIDGIILTMVIPGHRRFWEITGVHIFMTSNWQSQVQFPTRPYFFIFQLYCIILDIYVTDR